MKIQSKFLAIFKSITFDKNSFPLAELGLVGFAEIIAVIK